MLLALLLTILMVLVIVYDARWYIIPNWLNGLLLLLFPAVALMSGGVDWKTAYLGFLATFAFGFLLYALKQMGAGDVKLLAALAPFLANDGWMPLFEFLIYITLAGGALSALLLISRKLIPWVITLPKDETKFRMLRQGAPVPYGIGIAGVMLGIIWFGKVSVLQPF